MSALLRFGRSARSATRASTLRWFRYSSAIRTPWYAAPLHGQLAGSTTSKLLETTMRRSITISWLTFMLGALPLAAQQPLPPVEARAARIAARRVEHAPKIDGTLDDAVWQNAQWTSDFVQREPQEGQPATERTNVAFFYDDDALYIGAR